MALAAAAFIAGPEKYPRVLAAFDWRTPGTISQGFRVDAWIDPPAYTGRPPIMLTGRDAARGAAATAIARVSAPVGSVVVVRAFGVGGLSTEPTGGLVAVEPAKAGDKGAPAAQPAAAQKAPAGASADAADSDQRWTLREDGKLTLKRYGTTMSSFDLAAIPDKPPTISLRGDPRNNVRGSLTLQYHIEDDYGVVGAEANVTRPTVNGKAITGRTLVDPPQASASACRPARGALGDGETTADLSESPWAGARVTHDSLGEGRGRQRGPQRSGRDHLPQRTFTKPVARALVEQRRNLVLAPDDRRRVRTAMEALMIAPERIRHGGQRLSRAAHDRHAASSVRTTTTRSRRRRRLHVGDGAAHRGRRLSQAERDLRAAAAGSCARRSSAARRRKKSAS